MAFSDHQLNEQVNIVNLAYPLLVASYFVTTFTITVCTLQTQRLQQQEANVRRRFISGLMLLVIACYFIECITLYLQSQFNAVRGTASKDRNVFLLASVLNFSVQSIALYESKFPVWYPYTGSWVIGVTGETFLLLAKSLLHGPTTAFEFICIAEQCLRICVFLALLAFYFIFRANNSKSVDPESEPLLGKEAGSKSSATDEEDRWETAKRKAEEKIAARLEKEGNWLSYCKGFMVFLPYIFPHRNRKLQIRAALVGLCLLSNNALNVLVPHQMGLVVDGLTEFAKDTNKRPPWFPVILYATLRFISSGACIGWLKQYLWLPIELNAYGQLSTAAHSHVMSLSSDFHEDKTVSDITQAIMGGRSVGGLLETVCFQMIPMSIDLVVAIAYLASSFGAYMCLLLLTVIFSYFYITTKLVSMRTGKRRVYVAACRKESTVGHESISSWNTASLFNMIPYEKQRYGSAVALHLKTWSSWQFASQASGATQGLVMTAGLLGALSIVVHQIRYEKQTVGKFTTMLVYWAQLQGPINFFSSLYRTVSHNLMDAEKLLELFQLKPSVTDRDDAKPLTLINGSIQFDNVSFAYDTRKPTLRDVKFSVPGGITTAIVGETGGGKSTILKLMNRSYDVKGGRILIDGQDIKDVQLTSLREKIGVVPQEPTLFNDSVINNIRYARLDATDEEVYDACKRAAIHEKIVTFTDGYNTKVGYDGVKLSGGERQRIAIARAFLKNPDIILLDEATSAVDTETEQKIQSGFTELSKGRTTFIIAHRLSTIMRADYILVVKDGEIIEAGSHEKLLRQKGKYHDLWSRQVLAIPEFEGDNPTDLPNIGMEIVNDLTDSAKNESAKLLGVSTTRTADKKESSALQNVNKSAVLASKTESKNGSEISQLNPDAPEFVPLGSRTNWNESTVQRNNSVRALTPRGQVGVICGKSQASRVEVKLDKDGSLLPIGRLLNSTDRSEDIEAIKDHLIFSKPKVKRSRNSRRVTSKSEPPNKPHEVPGTEALSEAVITSGKGPQQLRRTSDTPGSIAYRGPRSERNRHWRLKNRALDRDSNPNTGPSTVTIAQTDETPSIAPAKEQNT